MIEQFLQSLPGDRQPAHVFFSRRNAIQIPQFMPQGEMSLIFILFTGKEPVCSTMTINCPKISGGT